MHGKTWEFAVMFAIIMLLVIGAVVTDDSLVKAKAQCSAQGGTPDRHDPYKCIPKQGKGQ